jgi:hypothetical protein
MSTTSDLELVTTPRTTIMEDEDEKKAYLTTTLNHALNTFSTP